jgi:hypothetical protein
MQKPPISAQLPFDVRIALARAAQTPVTKADPLARVKALEQAKALALRKYPELFRG